MEDGGLVAEANGVDAVGDGEEHPTGLRAAGDEFNQAIDFPFGQGVFALENCFLDVFGIWEFLEIPIGEKTCKNIKANTLKA